jgi:flagellar assembly factor FliW
MKKITTRFGEVEYNPDNTLFFPDGLVGLNHLHNFIVMPSQKQGPLFWIQSTDDPMMAFILTDPTNFFLDYKVLPDTPEMQLLGITTTDDSLALSIVTVSEARDITLNLAAPILFSPKTNRAIQVILQDSPYSTQTRLPEIAKC